MTTANVNEPSQPVSAGSGRTRSEKGERNANQKTPPTMKFVLGTLGDADSKGSDVVTDLLPEAIVRRVMEKREDNATRITWLYRVNAISACSVAEHIDRLIRA